MYTPFYGFNTGIIAPFWASVSIYENTLVGCLPGSIYYSIYSEEIWGPIISIDLGNFQGVGWNSVSLYNNLLVIGCIDYPDTDPIVYNGAPNEGICYCIYSQGEWGQVKQIPNISVGPGHNWNSVSLYNNTLFACSNDSNNGNGILYSVFSNGLWGTLNYIPNTSNYIWNCISIYKNNIIACGENIIGYIVNNSFFQPINFSENVIWTSVSVYENMFVGCYTGGIWYSKFLNNSWSPLIQISVKNIDWNSISLYNNILGVCSYISQQGIWYSNYSNDIWGELYQVPLTIQNELYSISLNNNTIVSCGFDIIGYSNIYTPIYKLTTYPNPIMEGQPATIIYEYIYPVPGQQYVLINNLGLYVSDIFQAIVYDTTYTFNNVILPSGMNTLSIYNITTGENIYNIIENSIVPDTAPTNTIPIISPSINLDISSICFKEGTKILCNINNQEKYIPIEQLDDTVFVKTYKHGYKKVKFVLKSKIINSKEKTINKLYVMKKSETNNLIEDLYVTGSHALLKNEISDHNKNRMKQITSELNYDLKIDDKYKIIACFDKRFQEFNEPGYFNIYHLVLEKIYGIYANGILAESTDEITLNRMKDYKLINLDE